MVLEEDEFLITTDLRNRLIPVMHQMSVSKKFVN